MVSGKPQVAVDKETAHLFAGHIVIIRQPAAGRIVYAVIHKSCKKIQLKAPDILALFLVQDHQTLSAASADRNPVGSFFIMYFEMSPDDIRFHNRLLYFKSN